MGLSEDAGAYVCNYLYYKSLFAREYEISTPERVYSQFIHVPSFEKIDE